jgi:hypothetical protein
LQNLLPFSSHHFDGDRFEIPPVSTEMHSLCASMAGRNVAEPVGVGSQHLRAMVHTDLIEVNVNDWFGGVAATAWGEWWQNYGTGRELRPDDPNQGVARNQVSGAMQLSIGPKELCRVAGSGTDHFRLCSLALTVHFRPTRPWNLERQGEEHYNVTLSMGEETCW